MLLYYLKDREIGKYNYCNLYMKYLSYKQYMCIEDHIYGYAPHVENGRCRFCTGNKPLNFIEYIYILKSKIILRGINQRDIPLYSKWGFKGSPLI